jgi:hypothetical protein
MKKSSVIGLIVGAAAVAAGAVAVTKVSKEMKSETFERSFESPEGNNRVTLYCGTSKSARGLTKIKVVAESQGKADKCKLIAFAKKNVGMFENEWVNNDHFKLLIGAGKRKQCCDVTFDGDKINAVYYLLRVSE